MKKIFFALVCIFCVYSNLFAYSESDFVWDFEWLEDNNTIEIALNEPYQLKYRCSTNFDIVFTSDMADNWVHYDLNNGQRVVDPPTAYSISSSGVITGLKVGKYAMKFTGLIQPKSGTDKWLYINIVSEKREVESNNTLNTANEFTKKIRFGLSNISDVDYFKCKHDASFGEYVKFKLHYYGSNSYPFGYKWAAFSGTDKQQVAAGSLINQDQECSAMIISGDYVYFEVYYNQSRSEYFNYGEEFTLEFLGKNEDIKVTSITLDKSTLDIALGEQKSLTATILPENASDKSIRWSSSNEGVAKVADGVITALSVGTTTITASTNDGSNLNAQCTVIVYDAKQKCGSNAYWSFDSATGLLSITGSGDMKNYDYSPSSSRAPWYKYRNDIISLSIGDQITSIGNYAFDDCSGLTSVTIPNSVTSIGRHAFSTCSGLISVTIPNSVTSIGEGAFSGCSGLISVTIPNSVKEIGGFAFYGCSGLTSVTIGNSVTSIGEYAFYDCSGLTSVTIPNSVTSIGYHAFEGCSGLTSVTIPNTVTSIGENAFWNCSGLTNPVYNNTIFVYMPTSYSGSYSIPDGITTIAGGAFNGCSGLTSVTIPNSVTSIEYDAFYNCSGLTSIEIPNSVTWIGSYAFYRCSGLTSVTIPNSVTSIGGYAFYGCSGLTSVTIPNSVTSIGEWAFRDCSGLTSVTIGSSVTSIGNSAFYGCSRIAKIEYYANCQYTGFSGLSSLKEVIIGDSVTTLYASFSKCKNLTKLTLGKSLQYIRQDVFSGCSSLKEVHSRAETPPYLYPNVFKDVPLASATLYVPASAKGAYAGADTWKDFGTIVSDTPDPVYKQLSITASKYGKVLYNGKEITGTTWNGKVEQGENLTFTIAPNPGCYLQKVTMNGMNVTKYLVDNVFTIEGVESDITLNVTFEKEDLTLTVKTSEGVEKEIDVEPGQQFTFNLSAYIDNIASVTFNGKDVTADIETKTESIPVWQLANNDIDKCSHQLYTTPAITESSELIITYKVNHPKGDTNEDGTVDVADITATASIILTGKAKEEEDLEEEW